MAIAVAIGVALAWGADRTLGVAGTVFAIATFALSQFQTQGPRTRSVVMIPKSRSPFSASIHRGLSDTLATEAAITLTVEWPKPNEMSEVEWQVSVLRSESCRAADGLVIIPAGDDESLWEELVQLTRSGVFIVVVDTKPMNSFFSLRRASRPNFVGSNFSSGGTLVGRELVSLLEEHRGSVAVVAGGPVDSWPGLERSRAINHTLMCAGVGPRTRYVELDSWNRAAGADLMAKAIIDMADETVGHVIAFCGNDKILESTEHRLLLEMDRNVRSRIGLIGYDGARNTTGDLMAFGGVMALATVDTRPEDQGKVAGEIMLEELHGSLLGRGSRYIEPLLVEDELAAGWRTSGDPA